MAVVVKKPEVREKFRPKIPEVREKFLNKFSGNILDDTYDDADVKWVKSSDAFVLNVLCAHKTGGDVEKSINLIDEILRFRAKYKLNSLKESDLNQNLMKANAVFMQGTDKTGYKLLFIRVAGVKKNEYPAEDMKRALAYVLNKHYTSSPEHQIVCVFDCTDAGVTNLDIELAKFVISCTDAYFPEIGAYALMFKLGRALEVVWTLIKTFMSADQRNTTHVVTRKTITEYIAEDQLLPHMIKDSK